MGHRGLGHQAETDVRHILSSMPVLWHRTLFGQFCKHELLLVLMGHRGLGRQAETEWTVILDVDLKSVKVPAYLTRELEATYSCLVSMWDSNWFPGCPARSDHCYRCSDDIFGL